MNAVPTKIHLHRTTRVLELRYEDGLSFLLSAEYLRVHSPSAEVRGHGIGQEKLVVQKRMVAISDLQPVGNYAVKIVFDDGHDTGLYTWQYLYELGSEYERLWAAYLQRLENEHQSRDAVADLFKPA